MTYVRPYGMQVITTGTKYYYYLLLQYVQDHGWKLREFVLLWYWTGEAADNNEADRTQKRKIASSNMSKTKSIFNGILTAVSPQRHFYNQ